MDDIVGALARPETIVRLRKVRPDLFDARVADDHRPMVNRHPNLGACVEQRLDEVRADESGPAGHEDPLAGSASQSIVHLPGYDTAGHTGGVYSSFQA